MELDTVVETKLHVTKAIENDCIDWLSNRDTTKPFMLLYQFKAPIEIETGLNVS